MRWRALLLVLAAAAPSRADGEIAFSDELQRCEALQFQVKTPAGWRVDQNRAGMAVRGPDDSGFVITREPMLQDPDRFAESWRGTLHAAGKAVEVDEKKRGRTRDWRASWPAGVAAERTVVVCRRLDEKTQMLYNLSFSIPREQDPAPLVEEVLRSFEVRAEPPPLRFAAPITLGRLSLRLPEGYENDESLPKLMSRQAAYMKPMAGYSASREAGRIEIHAFHTQISYMMPDGSQIGGHDTEKLLQFVWEPVKTAWGAVERKPRTRPARYGKLKGDAMVAQGEDNTRAEKVFYAFATKVEQFTLLITLETDAREIRLHDDLFEELCKSLSWKG